MFGLFGSIKKECPVHDPEKAWIEQTLFWFREQLGDEVLTRYRPLLPSDLVNDLDPERNLKEAAWIISKHLEIDPSTFEIEFFETESLELDEGISLNSKPTPSTHQKKNERFMIHLDKREFNDPVRITGSLVYHLTLLKFYNTFPSLKASGFLMELSSVIFGTAIPLSNRVISYKKWTGLRYSGWSISGRGFITQQMFGYAMALMADLNEETDPSWMNELCIDVKEYFKRGVNYIDNTKDELPFLTSKIGSNVGNPPPDYLYMQQNYYEDGPLSEESEMKNGFKDGSTKYFHRNGKFWAEWIFKDGIPFTVVSNFNSKGRPQEKGTLLNGNGTIYSYNETDELQFIVHFENGKQIKEELFKKEQDRTL